MFENRELTVRFGKKKRTTTEENIQSEETFEKKADVVLLRLEELGAKMFLGVCAYILLDTYRQVKVAQAAHPQR